MTEEVLETKHSLFGQVCRMAVGFDGKCSCGKKAGYWHTTPSHIFNYDDPEPVQNNLNHGLKKEK